jgi:protein TIF31
MHDMVSRAAKHIFSRYLRKLSLLDVQACVSHLLNCFIGYKVNAHPHVPRSDDDDFRPGPAPDWARLDVHSLQKQISEEVFKRYRYRLPSEWWNQCKPVVLLREVSLKMGFQLKAREYIFKKPEPVTNGVGKSRKANGTNGHNYEEVTFHPEDILNIVPVIKEAPFKVFTQ